MTTPQQEVSDEEMWGGDEAAPPATQGHANPAFQQALANAAGVTYPEPTANPHNHKLTWSPKLPDGSMLALRAETPAELLELTEAVAAVAQNLQMAWERAKVSAYGVQRDMQKFQQSGFGQPQQAPQQPNAGYQGQPAWQTAGAPQGAYQQPPQGQQGAGAPGAKVAPQGWMKLNVPFQQKDSFLAQAAAMGLTKGNPGYGQFAFYSSPAKGWYCAPEAAQALGQYNPIPV
ncbi:hypothetical protein [Streptomyces sp. URMC 129]|uniref:hypothetical protein n=1 Tax=Streptomyces sp. URMC 129 TaxID=3423407 RepID=UPI003F1B7D78